jgi:hypothetical protein
MQKQNVKYRVFDHKNNFHQSYDSQLEGSFKWAENCAKRINGYVLEYTHEEFNNARSSGVKVLDFQLNKTQNN